MFPCTLSHPSYHGFMLYTYSWCSLLSNSRPRPALDQAALMTMFLLSLSLRSEASRVDYAPVNLKCLSFEICRVRGDDLHNKAQQIRRSVDDSFSIFLPRLIRPVVPLTCMFSCTFSHASYHGFMLYTYSWFMLLSNSRP